MHSLYHQCEKWNSIVLQPKSTCIFSFGYIKINILCFVNQFQKLWSNNKNNNNQINRKRGNSFSNSSFFHSPCWLMIFELNNASLQHHFSIRRKRTYTRVKCRISVNDWIMILKYALTWLLLLNHNNSYWLLRTTWQLGNRRQQWLSRYWRWWWRVITGTIANGIFFYRNECELWMDIVCAFKISPLTIYRNILTHSPNGILHSIQVRSAKQRPRRQSVTENI